MTSTTARVAPDLSKALPITSDITVRRSPVDREDLKPYWKSEKKTTFLKDINKPIIYKFFKGFTNHRKKTNREVVFSCRLFQTFLNTGSTDETFQQSGKQDSFRHILKSSLVYIKVQTHNSLEIKTGRYYLFNHLGSYRNYMQFQLSSTRENKSRLEFLGKF